MNDLPKMSNFYKICKIPCLIFLSLLTNSCVNNEIGEKFSKSFDDSLQNNLNSSINSNINLINQTKEEKIKKKTQKEIVKLLKKEKEEKKIKKTRKPPKSIKYTPRPYRITIKLSSANPSAPAETVTKALRKAEVDFEVERIERVEIDNGQKNVLGNVRGTR